MVDETKFWHFRFDFYEDYYTPDFTIDYQWLKNDLKCWNLNEFGNAQNVQSNLKLQKAFYYSV